MQVMRAGGYREVASALRNLADEIERRAVAFEGFSVRIDESLEAVVDLTVGGQGEVSAIDIHLEHATSGLWNLTELQQALAHPGG
jgi:hypothetical protein